MSSEERIYGLLAEFDSPESLVEAAHKVTEEGYRRVDAFTPYPIEELEEALEVPKTCLPWLVFGAGVTGGLTAFFVQWYATVVHYPLNVGGRPLNSWPLYIPVTFELTVLLAGVTAVVAMFLLNGLPTLYHPLFEVKRFEHATQDGFFLAIEAKDPKFDLDQTSGLLHSLEPMDIFEVPQ